MDCIFCKIVEGKVPCSKVLEDETTFAFLDINPVNKGHVLVVPKSHFETLSDVPQDLIGTLFDNAKKVGNALIKVLEADGYNLVMNNYPASGQEVPHAHVHVVPRFEGDGLKHWPSKSYAEGEMDKVCRQLSDFL